MCHGVNSDRKRWTLPYHRDTDMTIFQFLVKYLLKNHIFTNKALVVKPRDEELVC
ncbi:hypothetical protein MCHI_001836 [Candidatus Magnetoovum chiemensis]|nr:hypothetical protein MCHI_001836 [Candidatus Magnetoovum chiemensis]